MRFIDYGQLGPMFTYALKHWKPQTLGFLHLPPEIRNMIYNLLVNETKDFRPDLFDLEPESILAAPSMIMLHTCTQVQQELLPLYFAIITPRLSLSFPYSLSKRSFKYSYQSDAIAWLDRSGPDLVDSFRAITLWGWMGDLYVDCRIKISEPRVVVVCISSISSNKTAVRRVHSKSASLKLAGKITESLKLSKTGLLGLRHFGLAEEVMEQLQYKVQ